MSLNFLNPLNPVTTIGGLAVRVLTAKAIEKAGDGSAQVARAQEWFDIATEADQVALGQISVADLAKATAAELQTKNIAVSSQILITGIVSVMADAAPKSGLLSAAAGAIADVLLKDIIATCELFGAKVATPAA